MASLKLRSTDRLTCQGHEVNIHEPNLILMTDFVESRQRLHGDHIMKKATNLDLHHVNY